MPKNKNAMTRYQILDTLLSDRYHDYSLDDLTREVNVRLSDLDPDTDGVVRRTIEKDIAYLEYGSPFMVEIERYSVPWYDEARQKEYTRQCLRYKDTGYSIFKKQLSDNEKYLLKETLSLLGQFDGLPNLDALERLRQGLGIKEHENRTVSFTKNPLEGSNVFGKLFTAIVQKQVIGLQYHTFRDKTRRAINLHPYLLKEYNHRWYIFGASETDGNILNFSLDRIDDVTTMPSHYYKEYNGDINEMFEDIVGVTVIRESPLYRIVFWVSDISKDYVGTKPIHESQRRIVNDEEISVRKAHPELAGGSLFEIECKSNYELIRELSSFGKDLIVLSPEAIQDKIWERTDEMFKEYQKLRTKNS